MKNKNRERVIEWFERAILKVGDVYINLYYQPHRDVWKELIKEGILKEEKLGDIHVGTSYKGYLFIIEYGPGDSVERLVCSGRI